ncbi:MAG TPA: phosphoribosylanthranilate isomerase [Myxococcota bacterium]|nr:phosphoribosylanthranilate isomerase [Myxococcota bacterium]
MTVRIKVCGITHPDDAAAAVDAGVDLIGLNFVPGSPRALTIERAEKIAERVAGQIERVAVFANAPLDQILKVLRRVDLERVQFHGDETEEDIEMVDLPVIKAVRGADMEAAEQFPSAILLLDHPTEGGGRGKAWDWSEASGLIAAGTDVILAGGLTPENVAQALEGVGDVLPWGVDVATGVDGASFRKDPAKIAAFVKAVREASK